MPGIKIISHQCANSNREYIKLSAKEVDSLPVKIFQTSKSLWVNLLGNNGQHK